MARWVEWATDVVETWPDDVTEAPFSVAAAEEGVALAEGVEAITCGGVSPPPPRGARDQGRP